MSRFGGSAFKAIANSEHLPPGVTRFGTVAGLTLGTMGGSLGTMKVAIQYMDRSAHIGLIR